jgi:hypothetical protein
MMMEEEWRCRSRRGAQLSSIIEAKPNATALIEKGLGENVIRTPHGGILVT